MSVKKVSVVMCTFNGAPYLPEQLDTIINQTYPIFEIIIQDDGSTDSTMSILHNLKIDILLYMFLRMKNKKESMLIFTLL